MKENIKAVALVLMIGIIVLFVLGLLIKCNDKKPPKITNWKQYDCTVNFSDGHSKDIIIYKKGDEDAPTVEKTFFSGVLYVVSTDLDNYTLHYTYGVTDLTINNVTKFTTHEIKNRIN